MTKQFQMIVPEQIREQFLRECGYYDEETPGFIDNEKFANLCATWGSNEELKEVHNLMNTLNIRGADYVRSARRPNIRSEKEKAMEALEYIDQMAIFNMKSYECYESLKEYRNHPYKLISSMPDEDT